MLRAMTANLPKPTARFVAGMLGRVPPAETHATCASCALCEGGGDGRRPRGRTALSPDVKCCSDLPVLPNFLVGGILADGTDDGRATLRARLARERHTPLGLGDAPGAPAPLGPDRPACPHLLDGRCTIHAFRNAGCTTFFCKHERGAAGRRAWVSLTAVLRAIESRLALWCCMELGVPEVTLQHLVALGGSVPGLAADGSVTADRLWSGIADREAFYVACHERVSALSWDEVATLAGPEVRALGRVARAAWDALDAPLPQALRPGMHTVVAVGEDGVLAETYSSMDPIGLPSLLLAVLHHFDGRPTATVLEQLAREQGVALDEAFLRELVDFDVLSGVAGPT